MSHLTADQLIDLAEDERAENSAPHLQTCDRCRRQLAELRATMSLVAEVKPSEPSPLFWEPLASRVQNAIELERTRAGSLTGRLRSAAEAVLSWSGAVPVQIAGVIVLVAAVGLFVRGNRPAVSPPVSIGTGASDAGDARPVVDDASLALVADLAAGLDWESAAEAGLTTHVGVDDDLLSQLDNAERRELRRLLQGELTPSRRGA